jgi:hypothetical protein
MGLLKILGLSTKHEGQHAAGKHTKSGATKKKQPKPPKK